MGLRLSGSSAAGPREGAAGRKGRSEAGPERVSWETFSRCRQHSLRQQKGGRAIVVQDGVGSNLIEGMTSSGEADLGLRAKHEDLSQLGEKCREKGLRGEGCWIEMQSCRSLV